jgi:hypothetical protein
MGVVRNLRRSAWVAHGPGIWPAAGDSLGRFRANSRRPSVLDLLFIGLTIVAFAVLLLVLKGIETFDR